MPMPDEPMPPDPPDPMPDPIPMGEGDIMGMGDDFLLLIMKLNPLDFLALATEMEEITGAA